MAKTVYKYPYDPKKRRAKYLRNKKNELAAGLAWKRRNKAKVIAWARRWQKNNPERVKANYKRWYARTFNERKLARLMYAQLVWLAFGDTLRTKQRERLKRVYRTPEGRRAHERRTFKYKYGEAFQEALLTRDIFNETKKLKRKENI